MYYVYSLSLSTHHNNSHIRAPSEYNWFEFLFLLEHGLTRLRFGTHYSMHVRSYIAIYVVCIEKGTMYKNRYY